MALPHLKTDYSSWALLDLVVETEVCNIQLPIPGARTGHQRNLSSMEGEQCKGWSSKPCSRVWNSKPWEKVWNSNPFPKRLDATMQLVSKAITGKAKQNDTAPSSQLVGFNGFGQTLNLCSGHFHTLLVILSCRRVQLPDWAAWACPSPSIYHFKASQDSNVLSSWDTSL